MTRQNRMNCEAMQQRITTRLAGELALPEQAELARHLDQCADCASFAAELERIWSELGDEPVPSQRLRNRFESWLGTEVGRGTPVSKGGFLERWLPLAATLFFGLGIGYLFGDPQREELSRLRGEVSALHETVAASLLAQSSVSKRLKGVVYGREHSADDAMIANGLITALLDDPSVNVRLAAVEALSPLVTHSERRGELVAAVAVQQSPLVQLSLIDVLLESGGPAVRLELERLLDDPRLEPAVSEYLRDRLARSV